MLNVNRNVHYDKICLTHILYKYPFPKDHQISFHTTNAIQALYLKGVESHDRQRIS